MSTCLFIGCARFDRARTVARREMLWLWSQRGRGGRPIGEQWYFIVFRSVGCKDIMVVLPAQLIQLVVYALPHLRVRAVPGWCVCA